MTQPRGDDATHPRSVFVPGEPALLLSRNEKPWRQLVAECGLRGLEAVRLRFVVTSWRRGGNAFDLDNLVDPVLAAVCAPPAQRQPVWATVELGDEPGVEISEQAPPPAPPAATTVQIRTAPHRSVRTALDPLEELVNESTIGDDEPCGCSVVLGADTPGVVFGFEGPVKPTIDSLWPLLGGAAHAPADHRIRDLRVTVEPERVGVAVSVWLLESA